MAGSPPIIDLTAPVPHPGTDALLAMLDQARAWIRATGPYLREHWTMDHEGDTTGKYMCPGPELAHVIGSQTDETNGTLLVVALGILAEKGRTE